MKTVILTCRMDRISLPEFGVVLTRGERLEIPEQDAMRSVEVQRAIRLGGLSFKTKQAPRIRDTSRRNAPKKRKPKNKIPTPNFEDRMKEMISGALRDHLVQISSTLENQKAPAPVVAPAPAPPAAQVDTEVLASMLKEMLGNLPIVQNAGAVQGGQHPSALVDDTPMFIPEGIVSGELKADIDTSSTSSKGSSVDAATEALRQLRKAKKKK